MHIRRRSRSSNLEAGLDSPRDNIRITVFLSEDSLPGAMVTATPNRKLDGEWRITEALTDASGRAKLSLPPRIWTIRAESWGVVPVHRTVEVEPGATYDLKMFTESRYAEPVTVY